MPPPGVLVGGLCVDDGRVGGVDGLSVVDGRGGWDGREELVGPGREELGLGMIGGRDGRGGDVPPSVGVLTWLPSQ